MAILKKENLMNTLAGVLIDMTNDMKTGKFVLLWGFNPGPT